MKSLYDEIVNWEKICVGDSVISFVDRGLIDISVSSYVMFNVFVPLLISFIVGAWVVKTKPGFIERISVDVSFVSSSIIVFSLIVKFCFIVFSFSSSASLYRMFSIWIEKFPCRVV